MARRLGRARVSHTGSHHLAAIPTTAPPWSAPSREVARRALARTLPDTEPTTAAQVSNAALHIAAEWGRFLRRDDLRQVLAHWQRTAWLRTSPPAPRRWVTTELGHRTFRAIARATGTRLPRRPRIQDHDHDRLTAHLVGQLAATHPTVVGPLRIARRTSLGKGQSWIIPDALVGFTLESGPLLLALEVERHGRYDNLNRHINNYLLLAQHLPEFRLRLLVATNQTSLGRHQLITDRIVATRHHQPPLDIQAALTTTATALNHLAAWGIHPTTPAWDPFPPQPAQAK
ncbi:hypothetical protein BJ970_004912 [Saccharopolyspora phatthalungensis]|uniref:Uncharacterized protein n=1 Tax=Saccharopolyspora phatthalungensis TaxID=664693 RepID=A0A840QF94_9PSEU|nr:hypothetical protein [Saccharopolyspora phatthalungensis]